MLKTLRRRLYRNRRRALVCFGGFFMMSMIDTAARGELWDLGRTLFIATSLGIIMTVLLCGVALFANRWRFLAEIAAMTAFVLSIVYAVFPIPSGTFGPYIFMALAYVGSMTIARFYAGLSLDKWTLRENITVTARSKSCLSPDQIWQAMCARPEHRDRLVGAENLISFEYVNDARDQVRFVHEMEDGTLADETQTYLLYDAPHALRVRFETVSDPENAPLMKGIRAMMFLDTGKGSTHISDTWAIDNYPGRMGLFAWVDDHFGRIMDDKLATLEDHYSDPETSQGLQPA